MNDCPRQNPAYRPTQSIPATHSCVRSFSCWLWVAIKLLQKLLQRRSNHIYYFRWVCPDKVRQIVGKRELIKSLHTQDELIARVRASVYYDAVLKITHVLNMTDFTDEQIEAAVQRAWSKIGSSQKEQLNESELHGIVRGASSGLDAALKRRFSESELETFSHFGVDDDLDYWIEEIDGLKGQFDRITGKFHCSPDGLIEAFDKYKLNLKDYRRDDCELLYQELKRMEFDAAWEFYRKYRDWESHLHSPSSLIINKPQTTPSTSSIKFSELYEQFVAFKIKSVQLTKKMQSDYRRYSEWFLGILGDLPVVEIKRSTLKDLILTKVRYLPLRNLKPYKNKTISELLLLDDIPEDHFISDTYAGDMVKFLQGMFAYAEEREIISNSPARSLKLDLEESDPYGAYTKQQMRMFLAGSNDFDDWRRWFILIAAYTGARLGEIAQLRKEDLLFDIECQRHYIRITEAAGSVKTESGNRFVPVHRELVRTGLIEFFDQSQDVLFPNLKKSAVTGWFPRFRKSLNVPCVDEMGLRLVFHSFRTTFITTVRAVGNNDPSLLQEVVGHEKTRFGITDRYTRRFPVAALCKVVDAVDFSTL